jgi:hypothetical protein
MRASDTAAASDEDRRVTGVGIKSQRLEIGAGAESELNILHRIASDGRVHERDADPIIGDEPHLGVLGAHNLGLI